MEQPEIEWKHTQYRVINQFHIAHTTITHQNLSNAYIIINVSKKKCLWRRVGKVVQKRSVYQKMFYTITIITSYYPAAACCQSLPLLHKLSYGRRGIVSSAPLLVVVSDETRARLPIGTSLDTCQPPSSREWANKIVAQGRRANRRLRCFQHNSKLPHTVYFLAQQTSSNKKGRINESTIPYSGLTNLTECCAHHTAACPNWSALLSDLPISKRYSIRPKSFSPGVEQDSHSELPVPCRTSTKNRLPKLDNDVPLDVSNSHVERPHPQLNVNYPIRTTKIDAERVRAVVW